VGEKPAATTARANGRVTNKQGPGAGDAEALRLKVTGGGLHLTQAPKNFKSRQLEILALRSLELADRAATGELPFIEAVDLAYSAAQWAGLPESVGDDIVQATLAAAFANARRP
jgi:hypothetical protein